MGGRGGEGDGARARDGDGARDGDNDLDVHSLMRRSMEVSMEVENRRCAGAGACTPPLTMLPSPSPSPSLAHTAPLPISPPSPPASLPRPGQPTAFHPSLTITHDAATFVSLQARTSTLMGMELEIEKGVEERR
jgi:hypothetical protein